MKVTELLVAMFEEEQKKYGTEVAIHNLLWQQASDQLKELGVKRVKTVYDDEAKQQHDKPKVTTNLTTGESFIEIGGFSSREEAENALDELAPWH